MNTELIFLTILLSLGSTHVLLEQEENNISDTDSVELDKDGSVIVYPGEPCRANTYFNNELGAKCACDLNGEQVCESREEQIKRAHCKPNTLFSDGCNICYCMPDRTENWCTHNYCYETARYCEKGKKYQIGCRLCACDRLKKLSCRYNCV